MHYEYLYQQRNTLDTANVDCNKYISYSKDHNHYHCHSCYEIVYIQHGLRLQAYDRNIIKVPAHSLIILPPLIPHGSVNITDVTELVLQFNMDFLLSNIKHCQSNLMISLLGELQENKYIKLHESSFLYQQLETLSNLSQAIDVSNQETDCKKEVTFERDLFVKSTTLSIIAELLREKLIELRSETLNVTKATRLETVINYLFTYPEKKLTMDEAAEMAHTSYCNFSRLFKEQIGTNYANYCNYIRVLAAQTMILSSDLSITDISYRLNFSTINYFNRIFKKYSGVTPSQFRKKGMIES